MTAYRPCHARAPATAEARAELERGAGAVSTPALVATFLAGPIR